MKMTNHHQFYRDFFCLILTFDLSFLWNLGATYSSTLISMVLGLMTGAEAGCCMERKAWIDLTSESYPESAIVLPLAASLNAAIHRAY